MSLADYLDVFGDTVLSLLGRHLALFAVALLAATVLGVAFGIAVARVPLAGRLLVPPINLLQACPELVLLAVAIPFVGIGIAGALVPLFVKGVLPILRNTAGGLQLVDPRLVEAASGIGMSRRQIFWRVEFVSALPIIIAGIRVSAVMLVSVITLTAYIGVESLGTLILQGISRMDTAPLVIGAGLTAAIATLVNYLLVAAERAATRKVL